MHRKTSSHSAACRPNWLRLLECIYQTIFFLNAIALATDRVFCAMTGERPGNPDGMKVDMEGNVYCTGPGGIWILDSTGNHLGTILTRETTTNMAWGDADWSTMYFTTRHTLGRVRLQIPGVPVPRGAL